MSQKCIDFLLNSFLMDNRFIDTDYSSLSEEDLKDELHKYREYILLNISNIQEDIHSYNGNLNVCIESFNNLPKESLFKQLALYIDQIVVPDPLFELTEAKSNAHSTFSQFMGLSSDTPINRKDISKAVEYIKDIYPLITSSLVILLPISLIHEVPKELPLKYSPNGYNDVLPPQIRDYYQSISHVCNINRENNGMSFCPDEPLHLGTTILVSFKGDESLSDMCYQYVKSKVISKDDKTRVVRFLNEIPDKISPEVFNAWVNQSINQAAIHHFTDRYSELLLSQKIGCMYLARSQLTANVLQMAVQKPSIESALATMSMKFDLPIFDHITLSDIMSIRQNEGEAFHNFRTELNSKLIGIKNIEDPSVLHERLDTIAYELNNLQVKDVEKECRKIKRKLGMDATILTGSLLTSFVTGGLTLVGAAGAVVKGGFDAAKYYTDIREHNGFFLWKLNKLAQKK